MTNLQAVQADIFPYTVSDAVIEKALTDNSLVTTDAYTDQLAIVQVSITVLKQLIPLASDSEGAYSQLYDVKGLQARIAQLELDNGLAVSVGNVIRNKSNIW